MVDACVKTLIFRALMSRSGASAAWVEGPGWALFGIENTLGD